MQVKVLKNGFRMEDAYNRLMKRSKKFTIENMDLIFYPYLMIDYRIDMGKKLERLNETAICMVDMFRTEYSIAKSRGEYKTLDVEEELLIPAKADRKTVIKKGPSHICGEIMAKKRVIRIPDIVYEKDELIYKPFFVVECKNDEEETFHILFDAVTGDFSLLNA